MIALSTEDSIIQVALGAAAAPDLRWSASYVKVQNAYTSSPQVQEKTVTVDGQTSGVAPVDITPAIEGDDYWLRLTGFYIRNSGAGAQTVIVRQTASSGAFNILQSISLDSGSHLIYNEESGWQTITSAGAVPTLGTGAFLQVANNLSDVASALTSFNNIKQSATEVFSGVAEIATQAETDAGLDDTRFVTPLKFQTRLAAYAQPLNTYLTTISGLSPVNDDILQYKSGAWAPRTVAQYYADLQASVKGDVHFVIPIISTTLVTVADSTTYYFNSGAVTPNSTDTNFGISFGYNIVIIGVVIMVSNGGTTGSNEDCNFYVRNVTGASSSAVGTFKTNHASTKVQGYTYTGLNIPISGTDLFCAEFRTPAFGTNPSSIVIRANLICKRA